MRINSIKPNTDNYKLDEITCFEKPIGIILDSYNNNLSHLYYMYIKLFNSYTVNCKPYSDFNNTLNIMDVSKFIINDNFNLSFNDYNIENDIHNFIENEILNGNTVLVPGNLKELFYSEHYKTKDWPHIFVIAGYDQKRKLYYIYDSTQKISDDIIYEPFFMKYSTLEEVYYSSIKTFNFNKIYVLSNPNKIYNCEFSKILEKSLDIYINHLSENPHMLLNNIGFIDEKIKKSDKKTLLQDARAGFFGKSTIEEISIHMINQVKSKNVYFCELINSITSLTNNTELTNTIKEKKNELIVKWTNLINLTIINIRRCLEFNYNNLVSDIIALEDEMHSLISELKTKLKDNNYFNNSLLHLFLYENNKDSIINIENNSIYFHFTKNKEYNCWWGDSSPKFLLNSKTIDFNKFHLQTQVIIKETTNDSGYLSGIVIKLHNNSIYYFGLSSKGTIIIDEKMKSFGLVEIPYSNKSIFLRIEICKNICKFLYSKDYDSDFINIFEISINSTIDELGLSCKTWTKSSPLIFEFNSVDFKS
ncbi:MAG: hypothetical protein E7212_01260 [Clostridium sartagoforme]|nr:hypothetical protein [Clostridium sartagoforme]